MSDAGALLDEFVSFQKIPRLRRDICVTEKIDGTNAQVVVLDDGRVLAGSRSQWITPEADNFGFARWVREHEEELRKGLGFGRHFGEWWGQGVQRRYGLKEKRFSLFNVSVWGQPSEQFPKAVPPPAICSIVPVLYNGPFSEQAVSSALELLRMSGSAAAPGFMQPEGVVVYHTAAGVYFKQTLDKDEEPKGKR